MTDEYGLADLARLADVTPRTIRYYIAQGLLPSPDAAGPSTRYGETHLLRLRLIRRLQREHLPLAGIRARLERLSDEEVAALLELEPEAAPDPSATLDFVRGLMSRSGLQPHAARSPVARESMAAYGAPPPVAAMAAAPSASPAPSEAPPTAARRHVTADRTTWERVAISPDVEVHVRRPLDRHGNRRVDQLIRIARELFEDER